MTTASQRGRATHYFVWTLAVVVVAAVAVSAYIAFGPGPTDFAGGRRGTLAELDVAGVPAELKSSSLIARGDYLTHAADCMACHTAKDGAPFAGGRAFVLPFGRLYSTNITPDDDTGIGRYTDAQFLDAVHKGLGRGQVKLYPAMPYASYTYMSDADALAIKAYLFSLAPVHAPAPQNTLVFPFNQRALMGIWSALFNPDQRFKPNLDRSAEWNRGAYLVEAMGHCGECHTPRNLFFALNNRQKFAGAVQAGWRAYNITPDPHSGVGAWSDADLAHYLSSGHADGHGTAAGPMGEAVDASLSYLSPADIGSIVTYLRSVAPVTPQAAPAAPLSALSASAQPSGKAVYEGACAGCHGWTGISPVLPYASLIGSRAVNDPAATNVAQVIIAGAERHGSTHGPAMPAFGAAYSDFEIASVANFVTAQFGAEPSQLTAQNVARLRSEE